MMIKYYSESPSEENLQGVKEVEAIEELPTKTELMVPTKILFPWKFEKDDYEYAFIKPKECNVEYFKNLARNILNKIDKSKIDFKIRPKTFISTRKTIKKSDQTPSLKRARI